MHGDVLDACLVRLKPDATYASQEPDATYASRVRLEPDATYRGAGRATHACYRQSVFARRFGRGDWPVA